jgi:predicted regulator of Ras-like GTPase activity (Roadblock/LC7/MglB family)
MKGVIMEHVLNEFKSVQGVIGAYIYNARGLVLANNLPAIFKEAMLLNIGKVLAKLYSAGGLTFPDISDVSLSYEESIVIVREITDKSYLIILSEPSLNVNLVTLTMNLIKDELKEAIGNASPSPAPRPAALAQPIIAEGPPKERKTTAKELIENGSLSAPLQGMQTALAKLMGPMAKIIFAESVEKWQAVCLPSFKNLPKLMEILALEIVEPEKVSRYEELVKSIVTHESK